VDTILAIGWLAAFDEILILADAAKNNLQLEPEGLYVTHIPGMGSNSQSRMAVESRAAQIGLKRLSVFRPSVHIEFVI
jgi:hypothetical protein